MKFKRVFSFVMALFFIMNIGIGSIVNSSAAGTTLTVSKVQGKSGSDVTVSVNISANSYLGAAGLYLKYDNKKLTCKSCVAGSAASTGMTDINPNKKTDGNYTTILESYINANGLTASGSMMNVTFTIKSGWSGTTALVLTVGDFCRFDNFDPITHTITNGSVTVPSTSTAPATPTALKAVSASYNSIKVSWAAVNGATGYEVWRSTSKTGTYTRITSVTGTNYINGSLITGKYYYYKVYAYKTVSGTNIKSAASAIVSAKPVPAIPGSFKAASASYNSIKLTWTAVSGANGYAIYRSTSKTGTYTKVSSVTGLSYTNGFLTTGKYYYYKVYAYKTVSGTNIYSAASAIVSAKPVPAVPGSFTAVKASSSSIKASWSAVAGASGYEIWRSASSAFTSSTVKTTTATSYTDTGLTKNKAYYYKVRAYKTVNGAKVYGSFTAFKSAKPY